MGARQLAPLVLAINTTLKEKTMAVMMILMTGLFFQDNSNFFATAEKQVAEGYEWNYIGKTIPDGSPAITTRNEAGEEFIYFKLKK